MKQRITYLVPQGHGIDPASIQTSNDTLTFADAKDAAVEKRVTAGLSELPAELVTVLQDVHELHIRWSSRLNYAAPSPFTSRLPPGLHVFFTPRKANADVNICPLLKQLFSPDLKCDSVAHSFSSPPILSERFSHSSSYQYFHPLARLLHFQTFLARTLCGKFKGLCVNEAAALSYASYVDIDFDAISHAVTLTAFWREGIEAGAARTVARKWRGGDSLEVGILQSEVADEVEEVKMGGYLTVVGEEDGEPGPTLFSFPSRHHALSPQNSTSNTNSTPPTSPTFSAHFQHPPGLHPNLAITFPHPQHLAPPKDSCALHAYLTLPSALFIDRYQLADPLFLASHNLVALHSLSGEQDLEAPDWVIKRWGSAALLELATPPPSTITTTNASSGPADEWTVTIPTHLRYLQAPSANTNTTTTPTPNTPHTNTNTTSAGRVSLEIPHPSLFWACEAQEGLKMSVNPFDRVNLGYDGLFGPKTMFYHIPPTALDADGGRNVLVERLEVPVLEPGAGAKWGVQVGTLVAVGVGFGWVLWVLFGGKAGAGRRGKGAGVGVAQKTKKEGGEVVQEKKADRVKGQ
ncbi:hypothetical protein LTR36_009896 [Oleoguttula mirabilis]|uniref:Protein PBN1 n=1 Tax=Oleoguttula mirabilis TaxID=1507867 RepID=A0AAV9J4V4_9PEZI|nr:hypothetical protein LTR36_009896 [Oleoguttula mirabilis]